MIMPVFAYIGLDPTGKKRSGIIDAASSTAAAEAIEERGLMPVSVDGLLAVGGHLKNTVAIGVGQNLFVSQHIGDLDTVAANDAFVCAVEDLQTLYAVEPTRIACDMHPDYRSTRYAQSLGKDVAWVQHHFAHVAAVMVDNELAPPICGVAWDGTGYGVDGTVWGGEFVEVDGDGTFQRRGHILPFQLPGGEVAIREPRRSALGLLAAAELDGSNSATRGAFGEEELRVLDDMLASKTGVVETTSMGRLFDGVASMLGLCQVNRFEGEGALMLEHVAEREAVGYPFAWLDGDVLDWRPLVRGVLEDCSAAVPAGTIAGKFHSTLAEIIVSYAQRVGAPGMVLSGGCFQNRLLTELAVEKLGAVGIRGYWPQRIPPNDGGLAVGQAAVAAGWTKQE